MTISYSRSGNVLHLFSKWKGSIWKACWFELLVFLSLYYLVRLIYNVLLPYIDEDDERKYSDIPFVPKWCEDAHYTTKIIICPCKTALPNCPDAECKRRSFEQIAIMFDDYLKQIPLTFLLGFYITTIVRRWWSQFEQLVCPDDIVTLCCLLFPGTDRTSRLRRHAIARYLNLTAALAWRDISQKIRRRFPTIKHIVASGLMTEEEEELYESLESKSVRWYVPLHWAQKIIVAEIDDKGKDAKPLSSLVKIFMNDLKLYRTSFRKLYSYDWVCVPLVYTQVAALATYGYFAFCLMGRQFLDPAKRYKYYEIDFVVPICTIVQFLFYVGWFKVGQDLMRPLGTDDDDLELNYILDRNIRTSFAIVNAVETAESPTMVEDTFWHCQDKLVPPVPHTKLSAKLLEHPPKLHSYVELRNYDDDEIAEPRTRTVPIKGKWLRRERRKRYIDW